MNISYNAIGLPSSVERGVRILPSGMSVSPSASNWGTVSYGYSAGGERLRRREEPWDPMAAPSAQEDELVDYIGNCIYRNDVLKTVLIDGGYIDATDGSYHFYVTDHLGSVRAVTDASGVIEKTFDFYPFGSSYERVASANPGQEFRYGGKQVEDKFGCREVYDFSARWYSPVYGRFQTMDPLCEKYYSLSPYAYCANNPMNLVDPSGEEYKRIWHRNEVVIQATLYVLPNALESARLASNYWNNRRKDSYVRNGVSYSIKYEISLAPISDDLKMQDDYWNTYKVVPHGSLDSVKKPGEKSTGHAGGIKNNKIQIDEDYSILYRGHKSSTGAHEIGHLLGLKHKDGTLMSERQDDQRKLIIDQELINMMMESDFGTDEYSLGYMISQWLQTK